jgi:leucyl aminopeptidase
VTDLLPPRARVALQRGAARPTSKFLAALDALLLIVPADEPDFGSLPDGAALAREHARRPRGAGGTYVAALGGLRVHVGVQARDATPFQRLALAGKLVKEVAATAPDAVGIASLPAVDEPAAAHEAVLAAVLAAVEPQPSYRRRPAPAWRPRRIVTCGDAAMERVAAIERGAHLARWLTALPPNVLTPSTYRAALARLAANRGWRMRVYDEAALRRAGCGAFLAVVRGSASRDAAIVHLRYRPRGAPARSAPVALVGKGLCFDTGGTNLKPAKGMLDMHGDMAGSAVAVGILDALTELGERTPVDAWLAIAENRIGPDAYTQNEVVTAADGTTIQVMHTDAEGRMALADTLVLAGRTKPAAILDFATLTGACVAALTERYSGAFTNRPALRERVEAAGAESGERVWTFPSPADFDEELDSPVADVVQCLIDGKGDHIYAARFLQRFVPDGVPWVHVDLSSAHRTGGLAHVATPVTGFGVRFGVQLLRDGFAAHARAAVAPDAAPAARAVPTRASRRSRTPSVRGIRR